MMELNVMHRNFNPGSRAREGVDSSGLSTTAPGATVGGHGLTPAATGNSRRLGRPLCLVISAPSGAGKTTLCAGLLREFKNMVASISCTTRDPRPGEQDGRDYYFITEPEFQRRARAGAFLEYAEVHGHWYGTPRQPIIDALAAGRDIVLAIDVQGAARIRQLISREPGSMLSRSFVDVFVVPPSLEILRQRLEGRGQDAPATIEYRLQNAEREMARRNEFRYIVVNDRLETASRELREIVEREHAQK